MKRDYYTPTTTYVVNIVSLSTIMTSGTPSFTIKTPIGSLQYSGTSGSIGDGV